MFEFLVQFQGQIREGLSASIATYAADQDWYPLLALFPFGVLMGTAHALTPGHNKSVLAAYVIGSSGTQRQALLSALVLAFAHVASAVVIALGATWLVSRTMTDAGQSPMLELVSRLLLVGVGAWLIQRGILGRPHVHGEGIAFGLVAGLVPCPLTLILMFYSASLGAPEAGLVFAAAMLAGVTLVLVAVALLSAYGRGVLIGLASGQRRTVDGALRAVEAFAGVALVAIVVTELAR